jgi:hypothetical protein
VELERICMAPIAIAGPSPVRQKSVDGAHPTWGLIIMAADRVSIRSASLTDSTASLKASAVVHGGALFRRLAN